MRGGRVPQGKYRQGRFAVFPCAVGAGPDGGFGARAAGMPWPNRPSDRDADGFAGGFAAAGLSPLEGRGKERYFARIGALIGRDYAPPALKETRAWPLLRTVGHISS